MHEIPFQTKRETEIRPTGHKCTVFFFFSFMHYAEAKYCDNVFCGSLLQSAGIVLCYLEVFVLISLDYLGLRCWVGGTLSPE